MLQHARPMAYRIFRRFSGGGTVLQGPGCLNYSLAVNHERLGIPAGLTDSYRFVLERHLNFCANQISEIVEIQGVSDLAVNGRKFSGQCPAQETSLQPVSWDLSAPFRPCAHRNLSGNAIQAARLSARPFSRRFLMQPEYHAQRYAAGTQAGVGSGRNASRNSRSIESKLWCVNVILGTNGISSTSGLVTFEFVVMRLLVFR